MLMEDKAQLWVHPECSGTAGLQKLWSRGTRGTKEGFIIVGRFENWTNNGERSAIIIVQSSAETMKTL